MSVRQKGIRVARNAIIASAASIALQPIMAAAQTSTIEFDIKAQSLADALTDFGLQSGAEVLFNSAELGNQETNGLVGSLAPEAAAEALLKDSGVAYRYNDDGTLLVGKVLEARSKPRTAPTNAAPAATPTSLQNRPAASQPSPPRTDATEIESTEAQPASFDEESVQEKITVVGSRIEGANATQRIAVVTLEDLKAAGVSNVEEAFRTILQNYSSTNSYANTDTDQRDQEIALGGVPDGVSAVNLRGLGSANTLVLLNGRRVAGAAGNYDNFTNLANIPIGAIERIEVLPDGASAAYGSDAIGGVVNIVLRDNYQGAELGVRYENSSTGGDAKRFNATVGKGWGSGRVTATLSYNEKDRIKSADAGYTTRFYPGVSDSVEDWDRRVNIPATGVIARRFALPNDNDGTSFGAADLVRSSSIARPVDFVPEFIGADSERLGVSIFATQEFTPKLEGFASILGSQNETFRESVISTVRNISVPSSNAFNSLGGTVSVNYSPYQEFADGLIGLPTISTKQTQFNLTSGLSYEVLENLDFDVTVGYSRSKSNSVFSNFFDSQNSDVLAVLTSDDPSVAVNVFGNGTAQNAVAIQTLLGGVEKNNPISELTSVEPIFRGQAFQLGGGDVEYVIGAELRKEELKQSNILSIGTGGQTENERDVTGIFAETFLPFVSSENARPGVQAFSVSLQARYDKYETSGGFGLDAEGELQIEDVDFSNVSPRVGFAYSPMKGLDLRGSWGESFRAPTPADLFTSSIRTFTTFIDDPFAPGGPARVPVPTRFIGGNLDLRPETSTNTSFGVRYEPEFISNTVFELDWSKVDIRDRIISTSFLSNLLSAEEYISLPGFAERDAGGNLTQLNSRVINLQQRVSETLDLSVEHQIENTTAGDFSVGLDVTYYLDLFDKVRPGLEAVELLGTARAPTEYNIRGHLGWTGDNTGADLFINYTPSYLNDFNRFFSRTTFSFERLQISTKARTTIDLSAYHEFDDLGLRVSAGARNLLDEAFPLSPIGGVPYDSTRVDPRGRVLFIDISKTF